MKTGGARGAFIKPLVEALEAVGYQLVGRPKGQHFKMRAPERPMIVVPAKLDDSRLARQLAKRAGVTLHV